MVFVKRPASLRHLLLLSYLLTVVFLGALLIHQNKSDAPAFDLSHASVENTQGSAVVTAHGEAFQSGIRAVFAQNLVNEEALLWRLLSGVPSRAVAVSGDLALVTCSGNKVVSIALHDGKKPELLGSVDLPASGSHIVIVGQQALVAMGRHAGFALIDLHDPEELKIVGLLPASGSVTAMIAKRDVVYFTDNFRGIGRIDLSVEHPVPEVIVPLPNIWRIALQGERLAVGSTKGSVHLFDIRQGGDLVEVGRFDYPDYVSGVAFVEETFVVARGNGPMELFSQSSWPDLQSTAQLKLHGRPLQIERIPGQASIAVSMVNGGMTMVDVSRPQRPAVIGSLKNSRTFIGGHAQAERFFGASRTGVEIFSLNKIVSGDSASLATEAVIDQNHYQLIPWNNRVYGYQKGRLVDLGEGPSTDSASEHYMAVADHDRVGFFTQGEFTQGENGLTRVDDFLAVDGLIDVVYRGTSLYVLSLKGLQIFSGTPAEGFVKMSDLQLPSESKACEALNSGCLLVTVDSLDGDGVVVVDVRDPRQPVPLARVTSPFHLQSRNIIHDIIVDGQRAYIAQGSGGIYVVDMSSPSRPEIVQFIDLPGVAKSMVLYDDLLLVADGRQGLFMIDVADSNLALPVGTLPTPMYVDQLALLSDGLIVSSARGGTMKLPLPRRMKNVQVVNEVEMRVDVEKVETGHHLYLYDETINRQVRIKTGPI